MRSSVETQSYINVHVYVSAKIVMTKHYKKIFTTVVNCILYIQSFASSAPFPSFPVVRLYLPDQLISGLIMWSALANEMLMDVNFATCEQKLEK